MKCAIILALVALGTATPLTYYGGSWIRPSSTHKVMWNVPDWRAEKETANQIAHQVTEHGVHDQLAHTHEAIKDLQWKLQQYPEGFGNEYHHDFHLTNGIQWPMGRSVVPEAIHQLENDMEFQQEKLHQIRSGLQEQHGGDVTRQLHDTVQAGIEAKMAADNVEHVMPTVSGFRPQIFHARLQKLIDEHNKQEIENQISHHHHWAQQLHEQQQFVEQQKHQIEAQLIVMSEHQQRVGVPEHQVHQLQQTHFQLRLQEYQLIKEQLVHHLAMLELQKTLVHQEEKVLEDLVGEDVVHKTNDFIGQPMYHQQPWVL